MGRNPFIIRNTMLELCKALIKSNKTVTEQPKVKPLTFVYVSTNEDGLPIAASNTMEGIFEVIDDYAMEKGSVKTWTPYNPKMPDSFQGYIKYFHSNGDTDNFRIYDLYLKIKI